MNLGGLKGKVEPEKNIVYYRRGLDELSLNVTNACPNACVFCIRDRDAGWGVGNLYMDSDPSIEEIIGAFLKEHARVKSEGVDVKKVKICGYGEPTLRTNDLPPILTRIRSHGVPEVQLTTTGWPYFRFISEDLGKLAGLREAGLTDIYLSMSATNAADYLKLVKPGMSTPDVRAFDDAVRFGVGARQLGLNVTLGFINLPNTDASEIREFAKRLGLKYKIREMEG